MNSQQELLDAINTISQSKDRSCDTPATVLRVEGDTVWVHIDGGADETPVQRTINCEQGETVQVRISNGSAFLVGNASAPPTDDKTANVAHFVAEQADEKATEAIESVNAIVQTVRGKVDVGDSNIQDLSSTMYQNEYGVNIFNDTLAVGDSYAHIDGDSFDIREATSAGVIDDANDITLAKFGADETVIGVVDIDGYKVRITAEGIDIVNESFDPDIVNGWRIESGGIGHYTSGVVGSYSCLLSQFGLSLSDPPQGSGYSTKYLYNGAEFSKTISPKGKTKIAYDGLTVETPLGEYGDYTKVTTGDVKLSGHVKDVDGNNLTAKVLTSTIISAAATSYTFSDDSITADSVIDIYDTIFGFAPTGMSVSNGSATITFPAQSSSHTIKLFVY